MFRVVLQMLIISFIVLIAKKPEEKKKCTDVEQQILVDWFAFPCVISLEDTIEFSLTSKFMVFIHKNWICSLIRTEHFVFYNQDSTKTTCSIPIVDKNEEYFLYRSFSIDSNQWIYVNLFSQWSTRLFLIHKKSDTMKTRGIHIRHL